MLFNNRNSILFYCFILISNIISFDATARKFYFSTTGNDSYTVAQAQNPNTPWKTLIKLETFGNSGQALAGDTFAFKRGDVFINGRDDFGSLKWWAINGYTCPSGTAQNPIVFTNYGTGALPNFLFPSPTIMVGRSRIVFAFNGVKYVVVDGLQFNDYRFPVNDKVSTAYTGMGILLGEEGTSSVVTNSVIKNCEFNNIGYGVSTCGSYNAIINNKFTNFKNVGDTSGNNDIGAVPIILQSGKFNLIQNNYIKGGWAFTGATASGAGLNGVGIEIVNNFDSSKIINNTIIDCAGAIEIGNITGISSIGCDNDTFAYNKIINTAVICYTSTNGGFASNSSNLKFWNNVFIENENSRFSGPRFGSDVFGDGQSFSGFTNWPSYPKNPSIFNVGGMRILQHPSELNLTKDTLYNSRNNIFWMTNNNQAIYDTSRKKFFHYNNIYHLVGRSVLGGILNTGNNVEIKTSEKIFSDTANLNPELWNFNLATGSPAINFGRNVGINSDFVGMPIVGNPDAGIFESPTSLSNILNVNINATPILCFGGTSNVTIDASGGTPPYSGVGTFGALAGTYNYIVNDAVGNSKSVTLTITQPAALTLGTTSGRIIEFGGSANITCTASGGKGTYTYKLDAGAYQTSNVFSSILAGPHIVYVKDSNNCVTSKSITLTQPSAPLVITATPTLIACNGDSSYVTVTATGGTAPYTGTGRFAKAAGTHTFTITDSNGVIRTTTKTITQPAIVSATVTSGTITKYGARTTITVSSVSGGTAPYTYSLNGEVYQTSNLFTNIPAGTYAVNIKDSKGCVILRSLTITQPATTLACSGVSTNILCNGGSSTISISATGGTLPYTGTGTFAVLAGTYTYVVTDSVGSAKSVTLTITQPTALTLNVTTGRIIEFGGSTNISCTATGGKGTYTYKLDAGAYQTSSSFSSVLAGAHIVYVKDSNNCVTSKAITLTQPSAPLVMTATPTIIACYGDSSYVTVTASGGTAPYTGTGRFAKAAGTHMFTITDSNGVIRTSTITITQPAIVSATVTSGTITVYGAKTSITISGVSGGRAPYTYSLNGGTYQTLNVFSNVAAGNYFVNIKDTNGCIRQYALIITQPASTLNCTAINSTILCNGGTSTVTISATGGTLPYTGTGTFAVLAGTYTYVVTDSVGSAKSVTLTITQPAALSLSTTTGRIIEFGGSTNISCTATGGIGAYMYKLDTGLYQTSPTFSQALAGAHIVYVKDSNNCVTSNSITLTQPSAPLVISVTSSLIVCNGYSSLVTVTASGGTAPYTGTGRFSKLAGTYTFTISDSNGVSRSSTITITQPTKIAATVTSGTITKFGARTTITVSGVSGGTAPYTYSLNTGAYQTSNLFNNILSGSYVVKIRDVKGCVISKTITITQPATTLACTGVSTNVLCNGGTSTITISATGGTLPYNGIGTFTVLAGTYTYIVTDSVGSSKSVTLTNTEPTPFTLNISSGRIIDYGGSTEITCIASGGKGPYTYKLDDGSYQTSSTFSSVLAGVHNVYALDSNNCMTTQSITITQPSAPLVITATPTLIACNGDSSYVTVTASGGTAPYIGTGRFAKAAGTHTFTITDSNGVIRTSTITITQPAIVSATVTSGTITKFGARTIITVSGVSGGTAPYTYSLNGGVYQTSNLFTNIPAGTYAVNIKDSKGCVILRSITITQPATTLACSGVSTNILCNGTTSTITISATGGTLPYTGTGTFAVLAGTYTYVVTDSVGSSKSVTLTITQPAELTLNLTTGRIIEFGGSTNISCTATGGKGTYTYKLDAGAYQTSSSFSSVLAGAHIVYVKDSNNCVTSKSITLTQPSAPLVITATPTLIACNGDSSYVTVTATGGTAPYTGIGRFAKAAGTHTFTITDSNGVIRTTTKTITQPIAINATVSSGFISMAGGTTNITVSNITGGTSPYSYSLNGGVFQTGNIFSNVPAGTHSVVVMDSKSCRITKTIVIAKPIQITYTFTNGCNNTWNGTITVGANFGTPPYNYKINSFGYNTRNLFTNLGPGTYTIYAKDANGVISSTTVIIIITSAACIKSFIEVQDSTLIKTSPKLYSIYPNPTQNEFNTKISGLFNPSDYVLYNSKGQIVLSETIANKKEFSFGKFLAPGIYYIRFTEGKMVMSQKIIKIK